MSTDSGVMIYITINYLRTTTNLINSSHRAYASADNPPLSICSQITGWFITPKGNMHTHLNHQNITGGLANNSPLASTNRQKKRRRRRRLFGATHKIPRRMATGDTGTRMFTPHSDRKLRDDWSQMETRTAVALSGSAPSGGGLGGCSHASSHRTPPFGPHGETRSSGRARAERDAPQWNVWQTHFG